MVPFIIIVGTIVIVWILCCLPLRGNQDQIFGVSFNPEYAGYLGYDSMDVFQAILEDWHFRYIRLSAQWDEIEVSPNVYDFKILNDLMDEAAKYDAKVVLVVGQKIPRWPECHPPTWADTLSDAEYRASVKRLIKATINQFKDHPALEMWQIENEPLFAFGECRSFDKAMLASEISMVRELDPNHKIMITDSGELSSWRNTAKAGDIFGTTLYRVVWHKSFGYLAYDFIPPVFYRFKLWLTGQTKENSMVSELQAEPWIPDHDINKLDLDEQYRSMNLERLQKNVKFSQRVGFSRAYLWGAEWWYWINEKHGVSDFIEYAKTLKKE